MKNDKEIKKVWPKPTRKEPSIKQLKRWGYEGVVEATDGCRVEPDGECHHGHPSWFIALEII